MRAISCTVVVVYAPNKVAARRHMFTRMSDILNELPAPYIIMGDWNCVLEARDRSTGRVELGSGRVELSMLCKRFDLHDTFRSLHPNKPAFTYIKSGEAGHQSRLDRIYVSRELLLMLSQAEHIPGLGLDHQIGRAHV